MGSKSAVRERNLALLRSKGFMVADSLPTVLWEEPAILRPVEEISGRVTALGALFMWVATPEEAIPFAAIIGLATGSGLEDHLTVKESAILTLPRTGAMEQHVDTIGWRLENMWSLAWVLGFEPPPALEGQMEQKIILALLFGFLGLPKRSAADIANRCVLRSTDVVYGMADLFYCAHNAVRSAQFGSKTVPAGFDPFADGGGIHERRHGLWWVLSPGVEWDDTDLST